MASEWIGLAIEKMVKESGFEVLSENTVYILPQMFFSAKSLLVSCMLEQSFDNIRLHSLEKLTLERVFINDQMVQ